jgi:hypothetical protein
LPRSLLVVVLSALVLPAAGVWLFRTRQPSAQGAQPASATAAAELAPERLARVCGLDVRGSDRFLGASGCAAASCHGGNGPRGSPGSELTTWATYDPHDKAYQVLFSQRSQQMWRNYRRVGKDRLAEPHSDALCLKCHALDVVAGRQGEEPNRPVRADGVSCESCHGPSQSWRNEHYQQGWKERSVTAKTAAGLWPTKSLSFRVLLCATCHVGAPGQEVNHDLIAAGHPALRFEYTAFDQVLPRHWPAENGSGNEDYEARAWLIGQVASLRCALDLLQSRAQNAARGPWPEFAEYSCFSCHHQVPKEWRQQPAGAGRKAGDLKWNPWYSAMIDNLLGAGTILDKTAPSGLKKELQELATAMNKPGVEPSAIAGQVRTCIGLLDRWIKSLEGLSLPQAAGAATRIPEDAARGLLEKVLGLAKDDKQVAGWEWETAAQDYLAAAALRPKANVPFRDLMKKTRESLLFPSGYDSPKDFTPQTFLKDIRDLRDALGK